MLSDARGNNIIAISDDVTAISDVTTLSGEGVSTRIYDLTGREVGKSGLKNGVYIVAQFKDGKKIKTYKFYNK